MTDDHTILIAAARRHATSGSGKTIRETALLSRAEIAAVVGVDESTVWRWEQGQQVPRGKRAVKWAQVLERIDGYNQRLAAAAG